MSTATLVKSFYGLFAALYLVTAVSILLLGTRLLPDAVRHLLIDASQDNLNTQHVMQESGTILVFVGLITLWFIRHYDQSRAFHWAMTTFWGLFALIHWFDIRGRSPAGPLVNTIPFLLFLVVGLLREWPGKRTASGGPSSPA